MQCHALPMHAHWLADRAILEDMLYPQLVQAGESRCTLEPAHSGQWRWGIVQVPLACLPAIYPFVCNQNGCDPNLPLHLQDRMC